MTDRILGVDPGTRVTGYGVVERNGSSQTLVECGVIRTRPNQAPAERLLALHEGLTAVIGRCQPSAVAVESVFAAKNIRSTIVLGQARGAIMLTAASSGLDVVEITPATVKKTIVGNGRAAKQQVAFMVQRLLRLKSPPTPDDAADGVAVALTHAMTLR